jgi:hypothetical protein
MGFPQRGATYHTRFKFKIRLCQKSLHTKRGSEAEHLEAVFRASIVREEFGISDFSKAPTLRGFEERLFPHFKAHVFPRTYVFYQEAWKPLLRYTPLGDEQLHRIQPATIDGFVQWRLSHKGVNGNSVARITVNHSLRTLRRALHLAKEWNP